jgi:hypothetical protein
LTYLRKKKAAFEEKLANAALYFYWTRIESLGEEHGSAKVGMIPKMGKVWQYRGRAALQHRIRCTESSGL